MNEVMLGGKPVVCSGCKKAVQTDEEGRWFCDCHDERVGIDPNHPDVVPIEIDGRDQTIGGFQMNIVESLRADIDETKKLCWGKQPRRELLNQITIMEALVVLLSNIHCSACGGKGIAVKRNPFGVMQGGICSECKGTGKRN